MLIDLFFPNVAVFIVVDYIIICNIDVFHVFVEDSFDFSAESGERSYISVGRLPCVDTASATEKRPLRARNPVRTTRSTYVNEASQPRASSSLFRMRSACGRCVVRQVNRGESDTQERVGGVLTNCPSPSSLDLTPSSTLIA